MTYAGPGNDACKMDRARPTDDRETTHARWTAAAGLESERELGKLILLPLPLRTALGVGDAKREPLMSGY